MAYLARHDLPTNGVDGKSLRLLDKIKEKSLEDLDICLIFEDDYSCIR